jgi:predicted DNA-binding transcriptional regulator YafY
MIFSAERAVSFTYTNWRGQTDTRNVLPIHIAYDKVEWHPDVQWLLYAFDLDRKAYRHFAMKDISNWRAHDVPAEVQPQLFGG